MAKKTNPHSIVPDISDAAYIPSKNFNYDGSPLNPMAGEGTWNPAAYDPGKISPLRMGDIYTGERFKATMPGTDYEHMHGAQQSGWEQAAHGLMKGVNLTGTTVLGGFGTLYGIGKALFGGKLSHIWDNEIMHGLDNWNKRVDEEWLPNYYTNQEKDAKWYESANWATPNFLFDKLIKNSGFAVGAMISGNIANSALLGIGGRIGAGAARLNQAAKSKEGFQAFSKILEPTSRAFSQGKNIEAAMVLEKELSGMADIANKAKALEQLAATTNQFSSYANGFRRTAVAAYSSMGEANFEALQTTVEYKDKLIDDFVSKNGYEPTGEDLENIEQRANEVGATSFIGNVALLGVTEWFQLPYLVGSSYRRTKAAQSRFMRETGDIAFDEAGKAISKRATTRFGRMYEGVKRDLKGFEMPGITKYVLDPKEGLQEFGQFALQVGAQNYYDKMYDSKEADFWVDGVMHGFFGYDDEGEGVGAFTSKEGMEGGVIGMITGGLMQGRQKYRSNRQIARNTEEFIESLDKTPTFQEAFKEKLQDANRGIVLQEMREDAIKNGDKLEAKDIKHDLMFNYLYNKIKYGRFDMAKRDMDELLEMGSTEEGLNALKEQGFANKEDTVQSYRDRIAGISTYMNSLEKMAENVHQVYGSATVLDAEGNPAPAYSEEVLKKLVYASSKIADYDIRLPQLENNLALSTHIDMSNINNNLNDDKALKEAEATEVAKIDKAVEDKKMLATDGTQLKEELRDYIELQKRKSYFFQEYNDMISNPKRYETKAASDVSGATPGEEITVKTGKVAEKKVTAGEPYYLVESVKLSKDGRIPTRRAHKVKILKQNEDGSVEMEFENGVVKTVAPEQLAQYNLGKVEDTDANAKAKFVLEHLGEEYVHYGINQYGKARKGSRKNDEPAKGVLEYDAENDIVQFVWVTPKGKVYTRETPNTMFVAKKGSQFTGGMVRPTGARFTAAQKKAQKLFTENLSMGEKLERRANVANELYQKLAKEIETIANKIANNNKRLAELDEQIANAYKTKTGQPRKRITKTILNTVAELEKLKESLPLENERLQEQQILLEGELDVVKEFVDNVELMSNSGSQMISDIKEEMRDLESLIGLTKDAITQTERQMPLVEELYQRALKLLNNFVETIASLNPDLPLSIEEYQTNMERFLGEEGAAGVIARREGFTSQIMDIENTILSYSEKLRFPRHEKRFMDMSRDLKELRDNLPKLEANLRAQEKILEAFRDYYREQRDLLKAEETLKDNGKVDTQIDSSLDKEGETQAYDPDFKPLPKKASTILPTATIVSSADSHDYQKRSNEFGFKLPSLQDAGKAIEAVYVTIKTEGAVGMTGLIKKLSTDEQGKLKEGVDPETIIAVVMVTETDEGLVPVDINGDPIKDDNLNEGIYQVMPLETLTWSNGESMFRETASQEVKDEITQRYTEWRGEVLSRNDIDTAFEPMSSFGILSFEEGQRTSVTDAGFVPNENHIQNHKVINVSTTQKILTKGTTNYPNPYKRVLIETDNGYAQLQNTQHSEEQATTIYRAILALANELTNNVDGLASPKASRLLDYLKGVVYWGLPTDQKGKMKDPGYSSIYFRKEPGADFQTLFVGNKGARFVFTPTGVKSRSGEIISAIQELYSNTNYKKVRDMDKKYEEIVSMSEEGEIVETRLWPNYQTYLLSAFLPNESGEGVTTKSRGAIPLTTVANPITESNPVNRTGIYFYNPDMQEHYTVKAKKKTNLKKDKVQPTTEISDERIIGFVSGLSDAYAEHLGKTKEDARADTARAMFVAVALDRILDSDEEVLSTPDPAEKKAIKTKKIKDFNERSKDIPLDKKVASLWDGYQAAIAPIEEEVVKPTQAELMQGIGEITVGEVQEPEQVAEEVQEEEQPTEDTTEDAEEAAKENKVSARTRRRRRGRKRDYRKKLREKYRSISTEDWVKVEKWLKANFPNIPVYRLKTVIQNTNGDQAWGMFEDGAIYVYENAEGGTVYHEVFEAVWRMFTPEAEQQSVISEFKGRKGSFVDRPTGETVNFSEATDQQVKEQLAEEFRAFVNRKGLPAKPAKGKSWILKLFKDLKNFIKNLFVSRKSNINDLFKKIDSGYYRKNMPYARELSFAKEGIIDSDEVIVTDDAEFSKIPPLTDAETNDVVEEMIYSTLNKMVRDDNKLFSLDPVKVNNEVLFEDIKETLEDARQAVEEAWVAGDITIEEKSMELVELYQLQKDIRKNFPEIKKLFVNRIASYGVKLDDNDMAQMEAEDKTRNSDYIDATKVDKFKKMNSALKLLFNTVAEVDAEGYDLTSSIGGVKTLTFGQVTNTLMKRLHKSKNINEMQENFRQLAVSDPNYRRLYKRFFRADHTEEGVGFQNINSIQSFRLISGLWKTFSLQAPDVKNVFILENGDIEVGDANLSTEGIQHRSSFLNNIILRSKSGQGFFTYKPSTSLYVINKDKLGKFTLRANKTSYKKFLAELGVDFSVQEMNKLSKNQYAQFREVVNGIRKSLNSIQSINTFSSTSLDLHGRLMTLGLLKAAASNIAYESTYFNVAGERTQTFIGGNSPSRLFRFLSQIDNIQELQGTEYEYLIPKNDVFADGSVIIQKMFDEDGNRKPMVRDEQLMAVGYVGGTINERKGRKTESKRLKFRDRFLQEVNLNLKGWYLNLVPGDSSTEWMTFMGNHIDDAALNRVDEKGKLPAEVHRIFRNYFISEVNMSREKRDVHSSRNRRDLRFFQSILEADTLASIRRSKAKAETLYTRHQVAIEKAIEAHVKKNTENLRRYLNKFNAIQEDFANKGKYRIENVNINNVTETQLDNKLTMLTINYMINNIEQHKLIYGDPFQYKDELKRTKSFQSPRQEVLNSSNEVNELMDEIWNKNYTKRPFGFTNFIRDYFRTVTFSDIKVVSEFAAYGIMDETDGGGIITLKGLRNFKIRSSDWTEANERQFEYEVKWEEVHKEGLARIKNGEISMEDLQEELAKLKNPKIKDTFTAIKPVVTGNKYGSQTNKTVLDKYSLYPLSYRMMIEMGAKNGVALHNKMQKEDIDYAIFHSGRKVGAYETAQPYNRDGSFNTDPYPENTIVDISFSTIGLQTEVPSKDDGQTTRGSQVTKIITMDRMDAGVPIDFMEDTPSFSRRYKEWNALSEDEKQNESDLYAEIAYNRELLVAQIDFGYKTLLKKLGIVEHPNGKVEIADFEKTVDLIKGEVLLREANDNIIDALDSFMRGSSVLEATPAYRQVSNILYSIVDKNIVHPKISGGMKVQIPSTFWEENRIGIQEINGKEGYTSDALGFYKDEATGDNVMEIMVGRWFKSDMSDEKLLEFLNSTAKGQEILRGFAFRIPTQNMNSVDAFRIKTFLPEEFGDNVVVPSAIVGKVGSDFDIDKLSLYLKNVFITAEGKPEVVPDFGIGEEALVRAKDYAESYLLRKWSLTKKQLEKQNDLRNLLSDIYLGNVINPKTQWKWANIFREWFEEELVGVPMNLDAEGRTVYDLKLPVEVIENIFMERMERMGKTLNELEDVEIFEELVEKIGEKLYKQGMQNAYIESNIRLLTHPSNHTKLTTPNSAKEMQDLAESIHEKLGNEKLEYSNPINFLDRTFMTELRHNFVAGKGGIAIAAVGQTNHANNQQQLITIDDTKIKYAPVEEQTYLGDGKIKFKKYNYVVEKGKRLPTLSFMKNKAGKYISDIMGMFIDGYVDISNGPWIMQMGATPETTGTWQFLIKMGVPLKDVAYFMNQPIIKDYLQMIENRGYSWLFIEDYAKELKDDKYGSSSTVKMETIPSTVVLNKTIGATKLNEIQKAQQQFYLDEFLKYAMMARHLFYVTQGTNYDTASFNNPYLLFKKQKQLEVARNSVISGPDTMLDHTFIGDLKTTLGKGRNAISKILISDKPNVRKEIEQALLPYIHLNNKDFVKMAERIVSTMFDWAVQTQTGLNDDILELLVNKGNVSQRLNNLLKDVKGDPTHPLAGNYVIELAEVLPSKMAEAGGTDNIRIKLRNSEVYDQNRLIYAFREIKDFLGEESDLYDSLIRMAILQSGLSPSAISFTSLLPFEDFSAFYNETMSLLEDKSDLGVFNDLHVFERNNWHNSDVVSYERARFIPTANGQRYNPGMNFLPKGVKNAIADNKIPQIATLQVGGTARGTHIVYAWEDQFKELISDEERAEIKKNRGSEKVYLRKKKEAMRKKGDFSFMHKALMQRVNKPDGTPYITVIPNAKGEDRFYYIYKAINAWGNGARANEFYDVATVSEINNRFMQVDEASDAKILETYTTASSKKTTSKKGKGVNKISMRPSNVRKILAGRKTTTLRPRNNMPDGIYDIGGRLFKLVNRGLLSVEEAGGVEAIKRSEDFGKEGPHFNHTKKFLKGEQKLYVYDITPVEDERMHLTKEELLEDYSQKTGQPLGEKTGKPIKEYNVGEVVIDDKYNVWKVISLDEWKKETRIPNLTAGVKARFLENMHPHPERRAMNMNPDSTTYITPNSVNTMPENMEVFKYEENNNDPLKGCE
jgi:hypothetical protein